VLSVNPVGPRRKYVLLAPVTNSKLFPSRSGEVPVVIVTFNCNPSSEAGAAAISCATAPILSAISASGVLVHEAAGATDNIRRGSSGSMETAQRDNKDISQSFREFV
jgi:hypothetical protein